MNADAVMYASDTTTGNVIAEEFIDYQEAIENHSKADKKLGFGAIPRRKVTNTLWVIAL
jgi:hypothetical protein